MISRVTVDSLLFALVGLMFVVISLPLVNGKIPPNHFYGFRTRKTLSDPKIWYEINRVSGGDLFVAGTLITFSSLATLIFAQNLEPKHVVFTLLSIMVLSLVGVTVHGFLVLRRM